MRRQSDDIMFWLCALLNAMYYYSTKGSILYQTEVKPYLVSYSTLGSIRELSLTVTYSGIYFMWGVHFCMLSHLYKYPCQSYDLKRGRLDIRLFTPTTMQQELIRYKPLVVCMAKLGVRAIWAYLALFACSLHWEYLMARALAQYVITNLVKLKYSQIVSKTVNLCNC